MRIAERLDKVIAGKYRIEQFIGAGGMGLVYAASHRLTEERVAVKFLRPEVASEEELTRRFIKEAQTIAQLKHPNVVRLMDLDSDPEYGLYMVLELLLGEGLDVYLTRVGRMPLERICDWLLPVIDVLDRAHARGVLHRDVKPANIFLHQEADGSITPKLLDFGLVRMLGDRIGLGTKTGQVIGTPSYMSPEQAHAEKDIGPESDVWSMGVVIYRCLSGQQPFDRSNVQSTMLAIVEGAFEPLQRVCPELPGVAVLDEILKQALRVQCRERTPSMAALRAQLVAARDQITTRRLVSLPSALGPAPRLLALGAAVGLLVGGSAWWLARAPKEEAPRAPVVSPQPASKPTAEDAPATALHGAALPPRAASDASVEVPRAHDSLAAPAPAPEQPAPAKKASSRANDLDLGEILVR